MQVVGCSTARTHSIDMCMCRYLPDCTASIVKGLGLNFKCAFICTRLCRHSRRSSPASASASASAAAQRVLLSPLPRALLIAVSGFLTAACFFVPFTAVVAHFIPCHSLVFKQLHYSQNRTEQNRRKSRQQKKIEWSERKNVDTHMPRIAQFVALSPPTSSLFSLVCYCSSFPSFPFFLSFLSAFFDQLTKTQKILEQLHQNGFCKGIR